MSDQWEDVVVCWLNDQPNGDGKYLTINDIENNKKLFANMNKKWYEWMKSALKAAQESGFNTPAPTSPMFRKARKVGEETPKAVNSYQEEDISDSIPF